MEKNDVDVALYFVTYDVSVCLTSSNYIPKSMNKLSVNKSLCLLFKLCFSSDTPVTYLDLKRLNKMLYFKGFHIYS